MVKDNQDIKARWNRQPFNALCVGKVISWKDRKVGRGADEEEAVPTSFEVADIHPTTCLIGTFQFRILHFPMDKIRSG